MSYFDWLCMIDIPDGDQRVEYAKLMCVLMDTEFRWVIRRDENRAMDGLELRDIYEEETGEDCDESGPCSVLEMLTALAIRCNDEIMYDPDDPKRADRWFWMMIQNLRLDIFTNNHFNEGKISQKIENFMDRNYGQNGQNCPFFLSKNVHGFVHMEIWYQLNHYLMEKYGPTFA